jgi:hypothetical protein
MIMGGSGSGNTDADTDDNTDDDTDDDAIVGDATSGGTLLRSVRVFVSLPAVTPQHSFDTLVLSFNTRCDILRRWIGSIVCMWDGISLWFFFLCVPQRHGQYREVGGCHFSCLKCCGRRRCSVT